MARSGRKRISIEAPIMITSDKVAVWMDDAWPMDFFAWCEKEKFKITGYTHLQNKIKLSFATAKECTMFGLKYASRK